MPSGPDEHRLFHVKHDRIGDISTTKSVVFHVKHFAASRDRPIRAI